MTVEETVVVAEDERPLLSLYEAWLGGEYDLRTAESGRECLEVVDDDVAVTLLDRRMAGMNGDETLSAIRDRGIDCPVAMVSAVEPGVEVLDLPLEEYVIKPASRDEIVGVVESLLELHTCDPPMREFVRVAAKRSILEGNVPHSRLETIDAYGDLRRRFDALKSQVDLVAYETVFGEYTDSSHVRRTLHRDDDTNDETAYRER